MSGQYGIAITTRNRGEWMKLLFQSLRPVFGKCDIVIVNDGPEYDWIPQADRLTYVVNPENYGISKSKNVGIKELFKNKNIDYVFTIEDDVVIKNPEVFELMISASEKTKLPYFNFPAHSWESGKPHARTPTLSVQYGDTTIDFFPNLVATFSFYTRKILEEVGLFDEDYWNCWVEVDHIYRASQLPHFPPFWYFPCIQNIDDYLELVPESVEDSEAHGTDWQERVNKYAAVFNSKHGLPVPHIPKLDIAGLKEKLKRIYGHR